MTNKDSYREYREKLNGTYLDYVMASGVQNKLFTINCVNTVEYSEFIEENQYKIDKYKLDKLYMVDVLKYVESREILSLLSYYISDEDIYKLVKVYLNAIMHINANMTDENIKDVLDILIKEGILLDNIFSQDKSYFPASYGIRFKSLQYVNKIKNKIGFADKWLEEIINNQYEICVLFDVYLRLKEIGIIVEPFYKLTYFKLDNILFVYELTNQEDINKIQKFIDTLFYMEDSSIDSIVCLYNGSLTKDVLYKDITIYLRNITECMDRLLLNNLCVNESFNYKKE